MSSITWILLPWLLVLACVVSQVCACFAVIVGRDASADGSVLESMLAPDDPAYTAARDLREAIQQGRAKADQNTAEREGGGGGEGGSDEHF